MNSKFEKIRPNYKIWLETDEHLGILGDGKIELLKAIRHKGSLKAAMEELGWSYRKTWDNLEKIEERLGFAIIEKKRGGAEGGTTELTREGVLLLEAFSNLHNEVEPFMQQAFDKFTKHLKQING